ncbi:MAG: TetR family transcriptional regulator [Pseudomonadota bacterium]
MPIQTGATRSDGEINKQAQRSALSDAKMLEAAITLVNERGTAKTTLKEIGEVAGYSRGLASYRFGSKDGLWMELFARFDDIWKSHLREYLQGKVGLEAIRLAMRAQRDFFHREPSYLRAMYILWYESLGKESGIRAKLAGHHRIYRRDVKRWVEEGQAAGDISTDIDADNFSASYCAHMFGTIYQWVVAPDALDLDAVLDNFQENTIFVLTQKRD